MILIIIQYALITIISIIVFYSLGQKFRVPYLVLLSCGLIGSLSINLLIYLVIYSLINFKIGLWLSKTKHKKTLFRFGIIVNLLQIIVLKYADFTLQPIFGLLNFEIDLNILNRYIVPLGISYFTLQAIGYLMNIKLGWENPERRILNFILYITFYPKFLSGPIERSNHFLPQLNIAQQFDRRQVKAGLRLALIGVFKKVAIANQIASFINVTWTHLDSMNGSTLWLALLLQPLYLYFDYSGYTDIAIGIAKTFGINLLPNFSRPFFAENMTTFWKRFHISLASWFNDYIFKQTVFRRRRWGIASSIYALLLTWILFGIWHGGGWNFMLLGLIHGIAIIYEFFTKRWRSTFLPGISGNYRKALSRIFTYLFFSVSLVLFFSPDVKSALVFFSNLNRIDQIPQFFYREDAKFLIIGLSIAAIFLLNELLHNDYVNIYKKLKDFWSGKRIINKVFRWTIYYIIVLMIFISSSKVESFVYVQF